MASRNSDARTTRRVAAVCSTIGALALGLVSGCKSSDPAPPAELPPSVLDAHLDGNTVDVELGDTYGNFVATCDKGSELQKADAEAWVNGVPACGSGPYYLDGALLQNTDAIGCACHESVCEPFPTQIAFAIGETFLTGSMPAPGPDAGVSAAADAAAVPDSSSNADAGADAGGDLPTFETRPYLGPYQIILRYHTDPQCLDDLLETPPAELSVSP
jgi:hypothetical protein